MEKQSRQFVMEKMKLVNKGQSLPQTRLCKKINFMCDAMLSFCHWVMGRWVVGLDGQPSLSWPNWETIMPDNVA